LKAAEIVPFSPERIALIRRVLSVAETDAPEWDPGQTYVYADGNNGRKQATVSIGFTADGGNLRKMLETYVDNRGTFGEQFAPWIAILKMGDPCTEMDFRHLVREAAQDPTFSSTQRQCFEDLYLGPAFQWGKDNGFALPLSYLVIADSFLHSGSVLSSLRNKFEEKVPKDGGDEKAWTIAYTKVRRFWLANHSRDILHATVYRCDCYLREIERENWDLNEEPIVMNGRRVSVA
jgi:chitosanase